MYYIGVDLGTSSVKLILMEASGNIVNTVSKSYPIDFPKPGWSEQNPYDWYDKTCEGIRELVAGYNKDDIAGISFGGQMHGLVILDEDDNVIRPAIYGMMEGQLKNAIILIMLLGKISLQNIQLILHLQALQHQSFCGLRKMSHRISKR